MHYMQRTAVQGTPDLITAVTGRWTRGARELDPGRHPFRKTFGELSPLRILSIPAERSVTIEDIEPFRGALRGSLLRPYDEAPAARNPLFGGRVAHEYFLISAAADALRGPGPTDRCHGELRDSMHLRFVRPVGPYDRIKGAPHLQG